MKKIIVFLLVTVLMCIGFSSCAKSEEVKTCEAKIEAIGEVTSDKLSLIEDAEKAYENLSQEDKEDVKNYSVLTSAREEIDDISDFNEKADALSEKLQKTVTEYGIDAKGITDEYKALLDRYDTASEIKKAQLTAFSALKKEKENYDNVAALAAASAASYVKGFFEINKDKDITISDIGCIAQQSDGNVYSLFALKYKEGTEEKEVYANARFAGTPSTESMISYKDNFYAASPASEDTDAFSMGNVIIDIDTVLTSVNE
ncbi:MAG: hypothetical protein IKL10_00385 [Clostridia bacterium]|nr:hypothetical protein [Clostridia bacterium]